MDGDSSQWHEPIYGFLPIGAYSHSDRRCKQALENKRPTETVSVDTKNGRYVGKISYLCDSPGLQVWLRPGSPSNRGLDWKHEVAIFLGIPYARPPLTEHGLRFKPPQPPVHSGAWPADQFRSSCPQPSQYTGADKMIYSVNEDCLYLNIYTPKASENKEKPSPVMIYIHDGDFIHGSGNRFPGHMLAASQDVVVVTFNYRLGILGFFSTADDSAPGNYGILDQIQLIHWVRENIRKFGGDPELITLFGPGAGAASAGILAISPLSRKYIKRVIAQSGSAVAPWAIINEPIMIRNMSIVVGAAYGCSTPLTRNLVECLKSRSSSDIPIAAVANQVGWLPFAPVPDSTTRPIGSEVIPDTPEAILQKGFPVDDIHLDGYLTGVTRDEGSSMVYGDEEIKLNDYQVTLDNLEEKIQKYIKVYNATLNPEAFKSALRFMYSPPIDPTNGTQIRQGLIDMYTDSWYVGGVDKMVKLMLKNQIKTYMYVLNYTIEGLTIPKWMGVPHDSEYFLISGAPFMDDRFYPKMYNLEQAKWKEEDRNMSVFFMKAWADFARHGDPTPVALFNNILWKPMNPSTLQYLSINTTNYTSVMHRDYKQREAKFWNYYMPELVGQPKPIWPPPYQPLEGELRMYRASLWAIVAILVILTFISALCSCLYCKAKRDRVGNAALDYNFPDITAIGTQYSSPSTRANSEISLSNRTRADYAQTHKLMPTSPKDKYKPIDKPFRPKPHRDTQTRV
ncbi:neuroligin-4, Y-linked-like isoform X2 [Panonychus citri]|nr:neuroligin-4, Y-linked-like isoform X2 [Panonychus citri]